MINSFIDLDFYKLTMGQLVFFLHKDRIATYELVCRSDFDFYSHFHRIKKEILKLSKLHLNDEERNFLNELGFEKSYLDFLQTIELNAEEDVKIHLSTKGDLKIKIRGLWHKKIYYETFILSIINEVVNFGSPFYEIADVFKEKEFPLVNFYDFGTRRRLSSMHQENILSIIKNYPGFKGTSNAYLARKLNIPVMGTMAHEYLQAYQQIEPNLINFQKKALYNWLDFYRGKYAVALSDTINDDWFIKDFFEEDNGFLSKCYDGIRLDSGDPIVSAKKISKNISKDSRLKLLFSDNLNPSSISKIEAEQDLKLQNKEYALGSYFMNNYHGVCEKKPLQIVMKMTHLDDRPVMKLSNNASKSICKDIKFKNKFLKTFL